MNTETTTPEVTYPISGHCLTCNHKSGLTNQGFCWACANGFQVKPETPMLFYFGKFEGCCRYVPYYWDIAMNGFADRDDGKILGFDVSIEDKKLFPELKKRRTVKLWESEQGFVYEV